MIYRYLAIIKRDNEIYTVELPAFGIKGKGFPDYEDTVAFAKDFLAEIILAYQKESRQIPVGDGQTVDSRISGGISNDNRLLIEVDLDQYKKRIHTNAERVFYEFETEEDVKKRNQPAFGGKGKVIAGKLIPLLCRALLIVSPAM